MEGINARVGGNVEHYSNNNKKLRATSISN